MIFDTMVLAYAVLDVEPFFAESVLALRKAPQILVPSPARAELLNVIWQWIVFRNVSLDAGRMALREAEALVTQFVSIVPYEERALELAVNARHSPYDTLFVALALETGFKVVTYDAALRKRFPNDVLTVPEFLAVK